MQEETLQLLVMLTDSVKEETIWEKKKKKKGNSHNLYEICAV